DFPGVSAAVRCRVDEADLPDALFEGEETVWPRALARIALSPAERRTWLEMVSRRLPRRQWLIGRLAAKDACRLFLKERHGIELCPADVELVDDRDGRPTIAAHLLRKLDLPLSISVATIPGGAAAEIREVSPAPGFQDEE